MRLPDFIVIGAAKAGTTTLYDILKNHPDVFMPKRKEPEFFARDERYAQGIEGYAALFAPAGAAQRCGEASTLYSLSPLFPATAARIRAHVPQARLIYVMREPVARAYSYYVQITKNYQNASKDWRVRRSFEECLFPDRHPGRCDRALAFAGFDSHLPDLPETFLAGSRYALQIERYIEHFPREQMLFLTFERLFADTAGAVAEVLEFIGVDPARLDPVHLGSARNISSDHFAMARRQAALAAAKSRLGAAGALGQLLPTSWRARLREAVAGRAAPEAAVPAPLGAETARLLAADFYAQMPRLRSLTGLDFAEWSPPPGHGAV
jgi:hypothetical protein